MKTLTQKITKLTSLLRTMVLVEACAATSPIRSSAYPVTLPSGYSAVGNHNNLGGPNMISSFMSPGGPIDGMVVLKLNQTLQAWEYASYDTGFGGWIDANFNPIAEPTFDPGEGRFIFNPITVTTVNVLGTAAGGIVPTPQPNTWCLVSAKTGAAITHYADIFGSAPPAGYIAIMARWNGTSFNYSAYRNGAWFPSEPSIPLGEGVLVQLIPDDSKPFAPISAAPNCALNEIVLSFNRDVDQATAGTPSQYIITGGGSPTVTAVTFDTSGFSAVLSSRRVFLTLSSPLTASANCKVSFSPSSGLKDLTGSPIQNGSFTKFKANLTTPRLVLAEPNCGNDEVIVNYDRPMGASAQNAVNYTLTPSAGSIGVLPILSTTTGPNRVRLKFSGPLNPATLYTLSVNSSVMSACGGALPAGSQISFVCNPNIIGMKYADLNANGVYDPSPSNPEYSMPNWKFKLDTSPTTTTPTYAVTDINGIFRFSVPPPPPAVSYDLTEVLKGGWLGPVPTIAWPAGLVHNLLPAAITSGGTLNENFGNRPSAATSKLKVTLTAMYDAPLRSPCCGQNIYWVIRYENTGNTPLTAQQVKLTHATGPTIVHGGIDTYINHTPTAVTYNSPAGVDKWTLPTLTPGSWGVIIAKYALTCTGSPMVNAFAKPVGLPGSSSFSEQALCSLDPNDKTVSPRGCGSEGFINRDVPLTYTVRFQNVGTGPAYRVVIRDMLDSDLDVNSVQMIDASHPYVLEANGQELVWTFDDIGLQPQSSDELGSQGYVKFTVQPQPSLPVNTVINNSADIYFDLNAPITTVTTVNTITDNPVPVSSFTGPVGAVAVGAPTDFTYTGGTTGATYFWDFGDGATPATSTAQNPTGVTWSTSGYKLVSLQVSLGGCAAEPALTTVGVGTPSLEIQRDGNEMVLTWHDENFTLQETDRLDLPESWHDSTATVNVVSGTVTTRVPIVAGSMFYRLAL